MRWHVNVARYHMQQILPDMLAVNCLQPFLEAAKAVLMLEIAMEKAQEIEDGRHDTPTENLPDHSSGSS